jgi:hypothetical protein
MIQTEKRDFMMDRLKNIYLLYDQIMASATGACSPGCDRCCTCNVTLTGLEARLMTKALIQTGAGRLTRPSFKDFRQSGPSPANRNHGKTITKIRFGLTNGPA